MKNAYGRILEHMQIQGSKNNPPSIQIGVVIAADPLTIKVGDLPIDKNNLLIADYLLKDYKMEISMPLADVTGVISSVSVGDYGSHTHEISKLEIVKGTINSIIGFVKDDVVVLLKTDDEQTYIILARVVSL